MSWFDTLFGVKVTIKVRQPDGSVLERKLTMKQLAKACEAGWALCDKAQVHVFNPDGSYVVWFHDRDDLLANRGVHRSQPHAEALDHGAASGAPARQPLGPALSMASAISPSPR